MKVFHRPSPGKRQSETLFHQAYKSGHHPHLHLRPRPRPHPHRHCHHHHALMRQIHLGIRESGNLPSWSSLIRRSPRSRGVLHHPLRGHLREDRHENFNLRDPPTGDPHQGQRHRLRQRDHVLQGERRENSSTRKKYLR